ncbi:N-glycosylase/DNA lyase [bacterium]
MQKQTHKYSEILDIYKEIKPQIKTRLKKFLQKKQRLDAKELFTELCFCLCTPQSKAVNADKAIRYLTQTKLLFKAQPDDIKVHLKEVRFHNKKARYICEARDFLRMGTLLPDILKSKDVKKIRKYLVKLIQGIGYKEASHYLRNIGLGKKISILDRHILKNLKKFGVIKEIPKTLTERKYLAIEEKMLKFSQEINVPLQDLDFVFWYKETRKVFK